MGNDTPGQISLVELIKASYLLFDVGAIGLLRLVGEQMAKDPSCTNDLEKTVNEVRNGVFVQEICPFASTLALYTNNCRKLPEELSILADHANQQGSAWVSAFCGIHQAYRRAKFGSSFRQVACRSGEEISIADQQLIPNDEIKLQLRKNICIYTQKHLYLYSEG